MSHTRIEVDLGLLASGSVDFKLHKARAGSDPVDPLIASRANNMKTSL
jgi:hypothetical protein